MLNKYIHRPFMNSIEEWFFVDPEQICYVLDMSNIINPQNGIGWSTYNLIMPHSNLIVALDLEAFHQVIKDAGLVKVGKSGLYIRQSLVVSFKHVDESNAILELSMPKRTKLKVYVGTSSMESLWSQVFKYSGSSNLS